MIQKLDWSKGNIFAYEASGRISKEEHIQIYSELREAIRQYGKVRLFILLPKMAWPDPRALGVRFSFGREHFFHIERYAVVSDNPFIAWVSLLLSIIPGFNYRHYSIDDQLLAKTWIEAKHV
jgi:hypothetical protein